MDTFVNNNESSPKRERYASQIMSFSHSSLGPESSSTVCIESGVSPSCGSLEQESLNEDKNVQLYATISPYVYRLVDFALIMLMLRF